VVQRALGRSNGRLTTAAKLLGISRPTLYALLETHGLATGIVETSPERTGEGVAAENMDHS
jgi:DNA-binding NtrC family response regulator